MRPSDNGHRERSALRRFAASLTLLLLLTSPVTGFGQAVGDRFPDEDWMRYLNVQDAGFDPVRLEAARATWEGLPSSAFLVIADGAVVAAWGDVDRRFMCHSVRKSFLSALYGIYWDRGEIELNKTLADLGIDDWPDPLLETERQARILDLLKARSGVFHPAAYAGRTDSRPRGSEGPGRYFAYNNWDFNTSAYILMQETGADVFQAFDEFFGQPLQMEDWRVSDGYYHYERDKSRYPAYPFRLSARDAARFGLLFARYGVWDGSRILSEHWVQRSSALYSIDTDIMGYGFYWWVLRQPPFLDHGMYAALGVGNQMIAVLPKSDMVIVNRANTYEGESTPMPALLDLVAEVLEARTGTPAADPPLIPLEESPDPGITTVPEAQLREFEGEWRYPPAILGLPQETTVEIRVGEGYLVSFVPIAGTFRLYLQPDGSLHSEDSRVRYVTVRDDAGVFVGIAEVESVLGAAIASAADGDGGGAVRWLNTVEGSGGSLGAAASAVVDLLLSRRGQAESRVRQLAEAGVPENVEADINAMGSFLIQSDRASKALQVFELDTRLFPQAFRAWDGLGRAHLALEQNDAALGAFERSLELNPNNANARRMIQQIRGG